MRLQNTSNTGNKQMAHLLVPVTDGKLDDFMDAVQEMKTSIFKKSYLPDFCNPIMTVTKGKKNAKIIVSDPHTSVFCFIDLSTGNILKAAGWKAPAKHARGNIHTPTHGVEFLGEHGAAYLRF